MPPINSANFERTYAATLVSLNLVPRPDDFRPIADLFMHAPRRVIDAYSRDSQSLPMALDRFRVGLAGMPDLPDEIREALDGVKGSPKHLQDMKPVFDAVANFFLGAIVVSREEGGEITGVIHLRDPGERSSLYQITERDRVASAGVQTVPAIRLGYENFEALVNALVREGLAKRSKGGASLPKPVWLKIPHIKSATVSTLDHLRTIYNSLKDRSQESEANHTFHTAVVELYIENARLISVDFNASDGGEGDLHFAVRRREPEADATGLQHPIQRGRIISNTERAIKALGFTGDGIAQFLYDPGDQRHYFVKIKRGNQLPSSGDNDTQLLLTWFYRQDLNPSSLEEALGSLMAMPSEQRDAYKGELIRRLTPGAETILRNYFAALGQKGDLTDGERAIHHFIGEVLVGSIEYALNWRLQRAIEKKGTMNPHP